MSVYETVREAIRSALAVLFVALAFCVSGLDGQVPEAGASGRTVVVSASLSDTVVSASLAADHGSHEASHSAGDCLHGQCAHSTTLTSPATVAGVGDFASTKIASFQQGAPETRAPVPPARPPRA